MTIGTSSEQYRYEATGMVANKRIAPLLPPDWIDSTQDDEAVPDFLWENSARRNTRDYRDSVKVYSHLPNGSDLLDSKWALGRLLEHPSKGDGNPLLACLETHCFRGLDGFQSFRRKVNLSAGQESAETIPKELSSASYPNIMDAEMDFQNAPVSDSPTNLWVVKDANSNGAGGVWVVGPETADKFGDSQSSPLYPNHRYVAQRYVWPPVLFDGRKFHVRVYGLFTSDGQAFVHQRAFLHVANDKFTTSDANETGSFQDSIHITNCCANSHDDSKFAGEILADFEQDGFTQRDGQTVIPLSSFYPSVKACVAHLATQAFPFLQGGQANHGFEYLGMDFMLSYNAHKQPVAYMLEINAPPSQDTATGLPHAENLHDDVIRDLTTLWVLPNVDGTPPKAGGWRCVHSEQLPDTNGDLIVPSKASIINKIRWAMFEKRALKKDAEEEASNVEAKSAGLEQGTLQQSSSLKSRSGDIAKFARSQFPYFSDAQYRCPPQVFLENAGGSQVAQQVIDAVSSSLRYRHRSNVGSKTKLAARSTLQSLLGAPDDFVFLGPNATSLLDALADKYVRFGLLSCTDEVVISTENHLANFEPWVRAAKAVGATIKLWSPFSKCRNLPEQSSRVLAELVTPRTRVVAIPHASNLLGQLRDIPSLCRVSKTQSKGYAHVVVDGVAATPHCYAAFDSLGVDWYVISCHKLFGPHLGALCGRREGGMAELCDATSTSMSDPFKLLESGTVSYEACAGVIGLGEYFQSLGNLSTEVAQSSLNNGNQTRSGEECTETSSRVSMGQLPLDMVCTLEQGKALEAYHHIRLAETPLVDTLLTGLKRCEQIRVIESSSKFTNCLVRLPTVSFIHSRLAASEIVGACEMAGICCRHSAFLCTPHLAEEYSFNYELGVVRVSLAHYNTVVEVETLVETLEGMVGWNQVVPLRDEVQQIR